MFKFCKRTLGLRTRNFNKTSYINNCLINSLLLFVFISSGAMGQTTIKCTNKNYANQEIQVYQQSDFISKKLDCVGVDTADNKGNFLIKADIKDACLLQIPLGVYNCLLYAEPNKTYQVELPQRQDKTFADSLNPYFQPTIFYLQTTNNTTDINKLILEFDNIYSQYLDQNYKIITFKPRRDTIQWGINVMRNVFKDVDNKYFKEYMEYRFAELEYISYKRNTMYVANDFFKESPILYYNTAYADLFNKLFTNYLKFYSLKSEGQRLYSDIALAKSPVLAKETFTNNLVLTEDSLQELVLLKGINDALGDTYFPKPSLMIVLDSIECCSEIEQSRKIAHNIKQKYSKTLKGSKAPNFTLLTSTDTLKSLSDWEGKYVYLNFCSVESFACQQDLEVLQKIYDNHNDKISIISISIDSDFNKAKRYFQQKGYKWTLMSSSKQRNIVKEYNIKSYPTYFFIDIRGNLVMSPAPTPSEEFEGYLFKYLQAVKHREARKRR